MAAAASEVDGSSTSRVLDSGGSRSSIPAGSAPISYGEGTVRFVERRRGELCEELIEGRRPFIASVRGRRFTAWRPSRWLLEHLEGKAVGA